MKSVWFTDCMSLFQALQRPVAKTVEKRLGMDLAGLRQYLWRVGGESAPDPRDLEAQPEPRSRSDFLRWIDTCVMVADPLTKRMSGDFLMNVIRENGWCIRQPEESKLNKQRKAQQRQAARDAEAHSQEKCDE